MSISSICSYIRPIGLILIVLLALVACQTPVMVDPKNDSTITAQYQLNTLVGSVETDMDTAFRASIAALDTLGYFRTGEVHKEDNILILSRKVGDEKVYVNVFKVSEEQSDIHIRIGIIGSLPESQALLSEIQDILMSL